jgi:hypothetical protein
MESDEELKSKFSNIFIMLLYSISTNDLDRVKHFLTQEMIDKYQKVIDTNINRKETVLFDELNVKTISITGKEIKDDYEYVYVDLTSRFMNYYLDDDGNYLRGNNKRRDENNHRLVFRKKVGTSSNVVVKCPGCGANIDANFSGKCEYCGMTYSAENYDYQLESITNLL